MYTTLGAPSGAFGGSNGVQSGTESRMSTLMMPLNGLLMMAASLGRNKQPGTRARSVPSECFSDARDGRHPDRVTLLGC